MSIFGARIALLGLVFVACTLPPGEPEDGSGAGSGPGSSTDAVGTTTDGPGATSQPVPPTGPVDGTTQGSADGPADGSTGTGSGGESDPGCNFLCPPDAGAVVDPCDVEAQDCPAGEKCVWFAEQPGDLRRDAARCIPVQGDQPPYAPCSLPSGIGPEITDDCDADSYCLEVYGTADEGFCVPFAGPSGDACAAYTGSTLATENGSIFPWACMYYDCNPLVPSTCPADMRCTFYPATLYGVTTCWDVPPQVDLPLGAECDFGQCGEGKLCVVAELVPGCAGDRCCTQWCDLAAPACDDPAATCTFFSVWWDEDPSFETLGACLLPEAAARAPGPLRPIP